VQVLLWMYVRCYLLTLSSQPICKNLLGALPGSFLALQQSLTPYAFLVPVEPLHHTWVVRLTVAHVSLCDLGASLFNTPAASAT
jgi:hypothetical protein